ncbi:MAG: M23 family metallopeptidase [Erythrobacter sp.]|uniref:M23 family metallopeptidase n=1 Tax=Erythrobacter sp. TaxID=1042 RepID=UPI0026251A69|nr:M23 family metallopeptidase [Erythrobacter sp.]MDJ0978537.1 M23 family metallopeptidase [Erythrobacter sp.]
MALLAAFSGSALRAGAPTVSGASASLAPLPALTYDGKLTQGGYIRGKAPPGAASAALGEQSLELAEDGGFFAAFDRDSPDTLELRVTLASGDIARETLSITPRKWFIQRINLPKRPSGASEAWWKRREPEYNAIVAARAARTGAQGWRQDFIWPVKGRISGMFGRQRIYRGEAGSYHSGIDIAPGNGVPFVAPADGVVVLAATGFSLEGGLIIIDHGAGLNSAFLHCSRIAVEQGEAVSQGQYIGNVGSSGRATGPHLHWSLKWNDARLDPLLFTGPME